ncbi:MAG TPA: DNA polymerase III subunit alpha [Acholeplasmataceae bacterium]|nr:DNA polymerase III subunit alpha [Acholeplasmataceae bacterium]
MIGSLYTQSTYSILKSTLHLDVIFKHAKQEGFDFVAIVDDSNLHSLYKRLILSKQYNIPTIVGFLYTFYIENYAIDLLMYAKDDRTLENLIRLNSKLQVQSDVSFEDCLTLLNELIVVLPSTQNFIHQNIGQLVMIKSVIEYIKKHIKGFYIGISGASDIEENIIMPELVTIAKELKLKCLPTMLAAYEKMENRVTYEIVNQIRDSKFKAMDVDMHLVHKKDLLNQYKAYPEVFTNLKTIFSDTKYSYLEKLETLPVFSTKDNVESHIYLKALADFGLQKRLENKGLKLNKTYMNRLNHELDVIHQMGYDDYFLIVYDFVRFAKVNDILVGPGRGSAAGSLVAYCLGITEVDPIEYDLLFERFLNIDRRSMPDIDLDFPDIKRDLVIDYVKEKYGKNHVVTMTTFTNLTTKTSMRDIARQMQLSQERINAIIASHAKGILDETDKEAMRLIEVAQTIEGIPRQTGTHPAGIILSKNDLTKRIPLMLGPKDIYQSQLEASDLENLGFLKIDFLGLKNLTMIEDILKLIQKPLKLSAIPLNDKKTFDMLSNADVEGVFQLESSGMRRTLLKLKPSTFEDIVAILALYRPGPMQFIDDYIARRHGKSYEKIDPEMDEILKSTYGIIVYQEQIMKILQTYAGYSLSQADIIRRAISKKDHQLIEQEKTKFIESAKKLNKPVETATRIYNHIEKFADYGFNRSHSVAYAFISYHMAYLKAHYYPQFMSVLMSQNVSNTGYLKTLVDDVIAQGIDVLPPNINVSKLEFMPYKNGLLAPLTVIKGIGLNTAKKIIELQPFKDYDDFKIKVKDVINEQTIQTLIYAGALDSFKLNRATLLDQNNLDQTGFENFLKDYQTPNIEELPFIELKNQELQALGFNLKYLKDEHLEKLMKQYKIQPMTLEHQSIRTIGVIENVKIIHTKKGDPMAFVTLNNGITLDLTVFPNQYKVYQSLLSDRYIYIEATKDSKQNKANKYIVRTIKKVKE